MSLKLSTYDGGRKTGCCESCGKPTRARWGKCGDCASKIAAKVAEEFKENMGNNLTEAILATGNEKLIGSVVEGAKLLEVKKDGET